MLRNVLGVEDSPHINVPLPVVPTGMLATHVAPVTATAQTSDAKNAGFSNAQKHK